MLRGGSSRPETPERGADASETRSTPELRRLPGRTTKPPAKMIETLVALEKGTKVMKGGPSITVRDDGVDGRTTAGQKLVAIVGETRQDVNALKEYISMLCTELGKERQAAKEEMKEVVAITASRQGRGARGQERSDQSHNGDESYARERCSFTNMGPTGLTNRPENNTADPSTGTEDI